MPATESVALISRLANSNWFFDSVTPRPYFELLSGSNEHAAPAAADVDKGFPGVSISLRAI